MESAEDLATRNGVPIQVHAYISPAPLLPAAVANKPASLDASSVRVRDGKIVELVNGADVSSLRVDYTYYQPPGTEQDVVERSLQPLVRACAEGVNTACFAVGSLRSNKTDLLFRKMGQQGLIGAIVQSLLSTLEQKASTLSAGPTASSRPRYTFSVRASFVELYEETILDLLTPPSGGSRQVTIADGSTSYKQLKDASVSPEIRNIETIRPLIESARLARRTESGLYGNATEFSSAFVRLFVQQRFEFQDGPTQELLSTLDIFDLPPTDRLSNSGSAVRLSEGPLLNKSLFALLDCVTAIAEPHKPASPRQPPFDESQLTQLLQDALGGNCLASALLFLAPADASGSRSTLQLGQRLQCIKNLPVVNNDMIRGLHHKYFRHLNLVKQSSSLGYAVSRGETGRGNDHGFISKIHELEGRLAKEILEKRLLKEDKDKTVSVMNELRAKYQQLFDNELEIRKELLACEQEKLTLSKAFVDFQMEKNAQLQDLDNEKFEMETKLIQAEEMVVQIQQDDSKKASQIQDLCQKMNEIIHEKKTLSEELALLQKHCQAVEQTAAQESKKNQQLSLELIVLVNQRQKSLAHAEALSSRYREMEKQFQDFEGYKTTAQSENEQQKRRILDLEQDIEVMRKEIARKEIDIEKLELINQRTKIEFDKHQEGLARNQETEQAKALTTAVSENSVLRSEKLLLHQELERAQADLKQTVKDREVLHTTWLAKCNECEELLVSNERLQHDIQSQGEEFRLQLSFLTSKATVQDAVSMLVQSYQRRERDLRSQIALQQQRMHRMRRQMGDSHQLDDASDQPAQTLESSLEVKDLRERLHAAELRVVDQGNSITAASKREEHLQSLVEKLTKDIDQLKTELSKSSQTDKADLESTRQMQTLILQQLDEVRSLSRSNQLLNPPPRQRTPVTKIQDRTDIDSQIRQLQVAKNELERKLESNQAEWMLSAEQTERRCADLLTKNIMLTEENDQLRNTLKSLIARIHSRR